MSSTMPSLSTNQGLHKTTKRTVLITGAGSGIGKACVFRAMKLGLNIIATSKTSEKLELIKSELPSVTIIPADISSESGRKNIANSLNTEINFVIHSAAYLQQPCNIENLNLNDYRKSLATNAEPLIFLTQKLLAFLSSKQKQTRVICISSGAAKTAIPGIGSYCISKAAAWMATEYLKAELYKKNILVNNYFPGVVDTPMQTILRNSDKSVFPYSKKFKDMYENHQLASPENIAAHIFEILLETNDELFITKEWDFNSTKQPPTTN